MENPELTELKEQFVKLSNAFVQQLAEGTPASELKDMKQDIDLLLEKIHRLEKAKNS